MKRIALFAFASLGLVLTGCGGSTCDDFKDTMEAILDKGDACFSATEKAQFEVYVSEWGDNCEESYDDLSDDEKKDADEMVEHFKSCVDELDTCEPDSKDAWGTAFGKCVEDLD